MFHYRNQDSNDFARNSVQGNLLSDNEKINFEKRAASVSSSSSYFSCISDLQEDNFFPQGAPRGASFGGPSGSALFAFSKEERKKKKGVKWQISIIRALLVKRVRLLYRGKRRFELYVFFFLTI